MISRYPMPAHLDRVRAIASILPVVGFYLQPSAGGRLFSYPFWRELAEIEDVVAIKIAPFNRYQTIDVVRAVAEAGRGMTSPSIPAMTTTSWSIFLRNSHWADPGSASSEDFWAIGRYGPKPPSVIWKRRSRLVGMVDGKLLTLAQQITDANAAFFDVANNFAGCIAGIHEVLRRQGLLEGTWCLDPGENLSPGQSVEIDRVYRSYPSSQ